MEYEKIYTSDMKDSQLEIVKEELVFTKLKTS